ncbi:WD40-repeat-containing domain protein [Gaertneriomyces semiglobifer]|nr:WD40-repeat-containing domain protein [Gaertneriomyces semiglobifer]
MNQHARASKIYDFVAHSATATCLRIGQKSGRVMVTGGEDRKVNLWAVGKSAPILSLSGHSSSIESVALDYPEEIVVAGSATGTIKMWDLEHAKVIRTLAGHKTSARVVEFHPFGEFFASGSEDGTVKIWDVRRKGCIQTYSGSASALNAIRITPDGRWIAAGGTDGTVKIWDMTAGKALQTYHDHTGSVVSLAFNPSEFLMVTAGADNIIRFYDLQSFECVSTTPANASKIQTLQFDPDGHELYAGYADLMQIWTWEPAVCHDSIPVQWANIVDMRIMLEEGKILAASLDQNFVGVWSLDITPRLSPTNLTPPTEGSYAAYDSERREGPPGDPSHYGEGVPDIGRLSMHQDPMTSPRSTRPYPFYADQNPDLANNESPPPSYQTPVSSQRASPYSFVKSSSSPYIPHEEPEPVFRRSMSASLDRLDYDDDHDPRQAQAHGTSHSMPTTPKQTRHAYVPSGSGEKLLNLDIARFIQQSGQRRLQPLSLTPFSPGAPPPTTEQDIVESLVFRHTSVTNILTTRLANVRLVRTVWDETNIRPTMETLLELKDYAVWTDLLKIVNLKPKMLTLEVALMILPVLNELLGEIYEDYIVTACNTIRILAKSFSNVIITSIGADNLQSPGIDFSREDRIERCKGCYHHFVEIAGTLETMKRVTGEIGLAARNTLRELAVFSDG